MLFHRLQKYKYNIINYQFDLFFTFIFLNLILLIDYYITTITEEDKKHIDDEFLIKFVTYFYSYFNRINSIMNLFVLPFMINCLETGYYSTCRIILESICRLGHTFWKLLKKAVIKVLLVIGLVIAIGVVILYYMFRKKYKLKEPLYYFDYISLASNIKSLIEIYINVVFLWFKFLLMVNMKEFATIKFVVAVVVVAQEIHYCIENIFFSR